MMGQLVADVLASPARAVPVQQDPCTDARSAPAAEDHTLVAMYLRMWFLATGRRLQPGVRPEHLTEEELIDFWAEDLYRASGGRHAARRAHAVRDSL